MPTVHVIRVWTGWPGFTGEPDQAQVDALIGGTGYVRMGYLADDLVDAGTVQTKLTEDAAVITSPNKQKSVDFPVPPYGTNRPDLVPVDFSV